MAGQCGSAGLSAGPAQGVFSGPLRAPAVAPEPVRVS